MEDGPMSEHKVSVKWARNSADFGLQVQRMQQEQWK